MPTLPDDIITILAAFAPLFSGAVFAHVQALVTGAILTPGRRTVAAALRAVGLAGDRHFGNYHRVLSRDRWSSRLAARTLLRRLIVAFAPDGPLVVGVDETLERRRGAKSGGAGPRSPPRASTETPCAPAVTSSSRAAACVGSA